MLFTTVRAYRSTLLGENEIAPAMSKRGKKLQTWPHLTAVRKQNVSCYYENKVVEKRKTYHYTK